MPLVEPNLNPTPAAVRRFAVVLLPAASFLASAWATSDGNDRAAVLLACVGLGSLLVGACRPAWMRPVMIAWSELVFPLEWLSVHAVLAAIYFLLITPLGLILRLLRGDPLARRIDPEAQSYWQPRRSAPRRRDYFRQF